MTYAANLFIISSPSGAGKSTLLGKLFKDSPSIHPMTFSISHTTRSMRPGEQNGREYHFVSKEEFQAMINRNAFFEWAEVFGNFYGTSRENIEQALAQGTDVFLDIDWQGARQIRKQFSEVRTIFILPPSLKILKERLIGRNQDSAEVIEGRMNKAKNEIIHYDEYDYVIVNDDLEKAYQQLKSVVIAERCKISNQQVSQEKLLQDLIAQ